MTTHSHRPDIPAPPHLFVWLALLLGALGLPSSSEGSAASPINGRAGEPPNNSSCIACHSSNPINSGDGDLRLLNTPTSVVPGQTYDLVVELLHPGQSRWGFELTVLDEAGNAGGTLVATDTTRTQLSHDNARNRDFLKQTLTGTDAGTPGPTRWNFQWIAPLTVSAVTFYFAGDAADNSGTVQGDFIYTRSVSLQTTPVEPSTWGQIKRSFDRDAVSARAGGSAGGW
jgi:hypothetical protein